MTDKPLPDEADFGIERTKPDKGKPQPRPLDSPPQGPPPPPPHP